MRRKNSYVFAPIRQKRSHRGGLLLAFCGVLVLVIFVWLVNYGNNQQPRLETEKVSVMGLDKGLEGFAVLHLSDLHASQVGEKEELWQELLFGKSYHAVVMTGDMVGATGNAKPFLSLIRTLKALKPDVPIFFIAGNEDPTPIPSTPQGSADAFAPWVSQAIELGATYLDAPMSVQAGKRTVWFTPAYLYDMDLENTVRVLSTQKAEMEEAGLPYETEGGASYRALCCRLDAMERAQEAQKEMLSGDLQIAVNHAPLETSYIRSAVAWDQSSDVFRFRNVRLLLCGHTCGGQWRLPGGRVIYDPELGWFPADESVVGMLRVNSLNRYISPGLGASEAYPFPGRLFNGPVATILKFTYALQ